MKIRQPLKINTSRLWPEWVWATAAAAVWGLVISHILWFLASDNLEGNVSDSPSFSGVPVKVWLMAAYLLLAGGIGAVWLGGFQGMVLRRRARPFGWWFWATAGPPVLLAAAKAVYYVIYDTFLYGPYFDLPDKQHYIIKNNSQLFELAFLGVMIALLQWLVLRQAAGRAGWWIIAGAALYFPTVITNLICRYVIIERFPDNLTGQKGWFVYFLLTGLSTIIIQGFLLGWLLVWLIKRPLPLAAETENSGE